MDEIKFNFGDKQFSIAIGIIIALFFFFLFGFTGLRMAIGFLSIYILAFFLILDKFELDFSEKIIFSLFIGLGIFPSIVYLLGLIISFKVAIAISFFIIIGVSLLLRKFIKPKKH